MQSPVASILLSPSHYKTPTSTRVIFESIDSDAFAVLKFALTAVALFQGTNGTYRQCIFSPPFAPSFASCFSYLYQFFQPHVWMIVLSTVLGPVLLGIFLNTYIFGFVGFQYCTYASLNFNDPLSIRIPIIILGLIDIFRAAASIYMAWVYCVENYLNQDAFVELSLWAYTYVPVCTASSGLIAHIFLGHRISVLTNRHATACIIAFWSITTFALGTVCAIWGLSKRVTMAQILSGSFPYHPVFYTWLGIQASLNSFISGNLTPALLRCQPRFLDGSGPLARLGRGSLQSGTTAMLFSCVTLIAALAGPKTNLYFIFMLTLGSVYSFSVMDTILSRVPRQGSTSQGERFSERNTQDVWFPSNVNSPSGSRHQLSVQSIQVNTEIHIDRGIVDKSRSQSSPSLSDIEKVDRKDKFVAI